MQYIAHQGFKCNNCVYNGFKEKKIIPSCIIYLLHVYIYISSQKCAALAAKSAPLAKGEKNPHPSSDESKRHFRLSGAGVGTTVRTTGNLGPSALPHLAVRV